MSDIETVSDAVLPLQESEAEQAAAVTDLEALNLDELREAKSACDVELIDLLARRQQVTDMIGKRKSQEGVPVRVVSEEHRVLAAVCALARERGLNEHTVASLFTDLFTDARTRQAEQRRQATATAIGPVSIAATAKEQSTPHANDSPVNRDRRNYYFVR